MRSGSVARVKGLLLGRHALAVKQGVGLAAVGSVRVGGVG